MRARQPELFAPTPRPELELYCNVAVPVPLRQTLTYGVTAELSRYALRGSRVVVPLGSQHLVGYIIGTHTRCPAGLSPDKVRLVLHVLDTEPVFPEDLLRFLCESADYYLHPLGEVLRAAAPAIDKRKDTPHAPASGRSALKARWSHVREETFVKISPSARETPPILRGARQLQLFSILVSRDEVSLSELRRTINNVHSVVGALASKNLVTVEARDVPADPFFGAPVPRDCPPELTDSQRDAVDAIVSSVSLHERVTYLLHGVTGSGKTEVYLRAIAAAAKNNLGALLLLPEISLTPQLVSRYRARFGDDLAVLHSGLKNNDRHAMWKKLRHGECRVAIGARSAIFAPVRDLGLIIVDEEHDPSFKQDDHFRYNSRDLALLRAHRSGIPCVLGSATPSVESYFSAMEGKYRLLHLPDRATRATLPEIEIVDLRRVGPRGPTGHELLSLPLVRALSATLSRHEQAILFLNRRGFAPSVRCLHCDKSLECPSCSVTLVLHRREAALRCHYCDFTTPWTSTCPTCHSTDVTLIGVGTEKLETALVNSFPSARVGRLDRDVASGMGSEAVLDKLRRGDIDILVGTQMVTKGHDIARVTLVGVITADASLAFPDFRAPERTFQLLSQVAGRAGRASLPGRVLIQTFQPDHPVLHHAQSHDYDSFYSDEISARRELDYPPFGRLAALKLDSPDETILQDTCTRLDGFLRALPEVTNAQVKVLGPAPSPIGKIRARFRMQTLLRCSERPPLRRVLNQLVTHLEDFTRDDVRLAIDVDPIQML